jgi:aryl-alcohol dehydrogenase-like predicted oxidoreductase
MCARALSSVRRSSARTTLAQLDENLAAAQFELDAETRAEIDAVLVRYPNPAN